MNDRFKFRVWDKENKRFLHYLSFDLSPNGILILNGGINGKKYLDVNDTDRYVLMQCTGLKDKNGKLIYEGDIVKSDFDFITNTINPLRFNIGNVIYSDYIAGFVIASDINDYSPYKTSFFGKTEAFNCTVIGNIYEDSLHMQV